MKVPQSNLNSDYVLNYLSAFVPQRIESLLGPKVKQDYDEVLKKAKRLSGGDAKIVTRTAIPYIHDVIWDTLLEDSKSTEQSIPLDPHNSEHQNE